MATMMAIIPLSAADNVSLQGDTLIIASDGDTVRLTSSQITKKLGILLDDTIINMTDEVAEPIERDNKSDWRVRMQEVWVEHCRNHRARLHLGHGLPHRAYYAVQLPQAPPQVQDGRESHREERAGEYRWA